MRDFTVGIDLGKTNDYTAIVVLEQREQDGEKRYEAVHLDRLPTGLSYPRQADRIVSLRDALHKERDGSLEEWVGALSRPRVRLVVDQTGVGQAVVDMLRDRGLSLLAVSITGGDGVTISPTGLRVPKRNLIAAVQVVTQTGRLKVPSNHPLSHNLVDEMLAFRQTVNQRGHDTYGNDWRQNPHDDMVLALALALWHAERTVEVTSGSYA